MGARNCVGAVRLGHALRSINNTNNWLFKAHFASHWVISGVGGPNWGLNCLSEVNGAPVLCKSLEAHPGGQEEVTKDPRMS